MKRTEYVIILTMILAMFFMVPLINSQNKTFNIKQYPSVSVKQLAAIIGLLKTFAPPAPRLGYFKNGTFVSKSIQKLPINAKLPLIK